MAVRDSQSRPLPSLNTLTWQWSSLGKLCRPRLGRRRVQELWPQLGLPQALMWWWKQSRGPWRLQVMEGGLGWGYPSRCWVKEQAP